MDLLNPAPAKNRPRIISSWSGTAKSIRIFRKNNFQQQSLLKKSNVSKDTNVISLTESPIKTQNVPNEPSAGNVTSADSTNVQIPVTDQTKSCFIQTNATPVNTPGRITKIITIPRKNMHMNNVQVIAQKNILNLPKIALKTRVKGLSKDEIVPNYVNTKKSPEKFDEEKLKTTIKNTPTKDGNILSKPDGVPNVKYRIIYPKDFEINAKSEITFRDPQSAVTSIQHQNCPEKESIEEPQEASNDSVESEKNVKKPKTKKRRKTLHDWYINSKENLLDECRMTAKVTRSGRAVKLPNRSSDDLPKTIRRKTRSYVDVLTCLRCHMKFHGVAKMNRHFAIYPTHRPNNIHTNLFMCFLDIMKTSSPDYTCRAFIEQLGELIVKIKSMLSCMINNIDSNDGKLCCINKDLGRMLDIEPGKYNISFNEAMKCFESRREHRCRHVMRSGNVAASDSKPSQILKQLSQHNEDAAVVDTENSDCARIHSVDEWPFSRKRIKKCLPVRMVTENNLNTLTNVDVTTTNKKEEVQAPEQQHTAWVESEDTTNSCKDIYSVPGAIQMPVLDEPVNNQSEPIQLNSITMEAPKEVTPVERRKITNENMSHFGHYQTSRFNLKSSPIKSTNTLFKKIQIKENVPMFVELGKDKNPDENGEKTSDIQLDLNKMLSELSNSDLANDQQQEIGADDTNEFYNTIADQEEVAVNSTQNDYNLQSSNNVCNISQCIPHSNFLLSNKPAVMSPSDRLLSSESSHLNRNDCLITDLSQSSDINEHRSENDFVTNTSTRVGQNDCLLSGRNSAMSKNDRLLSSSNVQLPQSDQFLSGSIRTAQSDSLASLCVSEANLEGGRMSLPLLDQLSADCLSFADAELRGSSLDLPLDLFPFNHAE